MVCVFYPIISEEDDVLQARNHYDKAKVDGCLYKLGDNAYVQVCYSVTLYFCIPSFLYFYFLITLCINFTIFCFQAEDGNLNYIARIVELFETIDKKPYFKAQWFYRAEDTVRTSFFKPW